MSAAARPGAVRAADAMTDSPDLKVTRRRAGDAVIVAPEGEIDLATTELVARELAAARDEAAAVVLDLRGVGFMDSSGLRMLVEAQREAERLGSSLTLVRGPAAVQRLLDLTGLTERLTIVDDPGELTGDGAG
jgi:anti-sigma B factor antagonist